MPQTSHFAMAASAGVAASAAWTAPPAAVSSSLVSHPAPDARAIHRVLLAEGVGRATTGAVVSSSVLILLLDVLLANLLLNT